MSDKLSAEAIAAGFISLAQRYRRAHDNFRSQTQGLKLTDVLTREQAITLLFQNGDPRGDFGRLLRDAVHQGHFTHLPELGDLMERQAENEWEIAREAQCEILPRQFPTVFPSRRKLSPDFTVNGVSVNVDLVNTQNELEHVLNCATLACELLATEVAGYGEDSNLVRADPPQAQNTADTLSDQERAESRVLEPLTDHERAVLDVIREQKPGEGIIGKQILKVLDDRGTTIDETHFRKRIIPRLKRDHGVKNRHGVGYYCADNRATNAPQ